jgi:hypothetical protein
MVTDHRALMSRPFPNDTAIAATRAARESGIGTKRTYSPRRSMSAFEGIVLQNDFEHVGAKY